MNDLVAKLLTLLALSPSVCAHSIACATSHVSYLTFSISQRPLQYLQRVVCGGQRNVESTQHTDRRSMLGMESSQSTLKPRSRKDMYGMYRAPGCT